MTLTREEGSCTPEDDEPGSAPPGREAWFAPGGFEAERCRARVLSNLLGEANDAHPRIGRFIALDRIGQGGMGVVYAAYDPELDRRVAVKVLRRELDSDAVRIRLRREAQAMAKLSHPNVAQVFEVGVHEHADGRAASFVAMELVRGQTLREWSDEAARSWRETVELYLQAARGLAAAHAAGLVHRDFKPDNAIVGSDGRVRVIDFGLVRLDKRELELVASSMPTPTDDALASPLTHGGAIMGTPAYMAAEQFMGEGVTAKSDQFAFCVALGEGLCGERPFEGRTSAELMAAVTAGRIRNPKRTEVPAWVRAVLVRGLAPSPADRHGSMDELVAALLDDPARRRRRRVVFVAAGVAVAGVAGAFAIDRELDLRACATEGERIDAVWNDEARVAVRTGLVDTGVTYAPDTAERVVGELDGYAARWSDARTEACRGQLASSALSEQLAARSSECFVEQRDRLGALALALANAAPTTVETAVTAALRLPAPASCTEVASLERRSPWEGADDATRTRIADLRRALADANGIGTTGRYAEAEAAADAVLVEAEALGAVRLVAAARLEAGQWAGYAGDHARASTAIAAAVDQALAVGDDPLALRGMIHLVSASLDAAAYDKATWWSSLAKPMLVRLGEENGPMQAAFLTTQGSLEQILGHPREAHADFEQVLAIDERLLGPEHPDVATAMYSLAVAEAQLQELARAKALFERVLQIREAALGPGHPDIAAALVGLGNIASFAGEWPEARGFYARGLEVQEGALAPDHPSLAATLTNLAIADKELGQYAAASAYIDRALEIRRRRFGAVHPDVAASLTTKGEISFETGDLVGAEAALLEALSVSEATLGADHPEVGRILTVLAKVHREPGDVTRARARLERALGILTKSYGADDPDVGEVRKLLAELPR